jgi:hypothetical protein
VLSAVCCSSFSMAGDSSSSKLTLLCYKFHLYCLIIFILLYQPEEWVGWMDKAVGNLLEHYVIGPDPFCPAPPPSFSMSSNTVPILFPLEFLLRVRTK